jgi:hypothetical protein
MVKNAVTALFASCATAVCIWAICHSNQAYAKNTVKDTRALCGKADKYYVYPKYTIETTMIDGYHYATLRDGRVIFHAEEDNYKNGLLIIEVSGVAYDDENHKTVFNFVRNNRSPVMILWKRMKYHHSQSHGLLKYDGSTFSPYCETSID